MDNIRSFIAVEITNPDVMQKIHMIQQEIKASETAVIKEVELNNLHITLKFLGEIDKYKLEQVKREIKEIKFTPFTIHLKGIGYFPGGNRVNVIWIGVNDVDGVLTKLGEEVQRRMSKLGFQYEKFTPHLTISRVKAVRDRQGLLRILAEHENEEFGMQEIEYICLKKSTLTPKGPIYEDIIRHGGDA